MKSREERLQDWKRQRSAKPVSATKRGGSRTQRSASKEPALSKISVGRENRKQASADKENIRFGSQKASAKDSEKATAQKPSALPRLARRPPASVRARVDTGLHSPRKMNDWSASMEDELENLTGRLDTLKRESLRPAIKGETPQMPQSVTRQILQPPGNTPQASIAARLQALKRETIRPSEAAGQAVGQPPGQPQFIPAGQMESQSLADLARELFNDTEFAELCDKGLNGQLQRTRDGATDKSRIAELAGLVKILRRGLKEMMSKSAGFVDASLKSEKEAMLQIEAVKLATESATKQMEAELANCKRDAAQAAAAHKAAMASWHVELDLQKAEASHAKRELERMESERDRAREEARRAHEAQAAIEGNVKGLKKEAGQQLRELQVEHVGTVRTLQEVQDAHARQVAQLKAEMRQLEESAQEAVARAVSSDGEKLALSALLDQCQQDLAGLRVTKEQLEKDCCKLAAGLAEHERLHLELTAEHGSKACEVAALRQRCATLAQQVQSLEALLQAAQQDAAESAQAHIQETAALQAQCRGLQEERSSLADREASLNTEKAQLKDALTGALDQYAAAEARLQETAQANSALTRQVEDARTREEELAEAAKQALGDVQRLVAELDEAHQSLSQEVEARRTLADEAAIKASRLARLEGEFEAMQEAMGTGSLDQGEMLGRLISRVASLEAAVADSHAARRMLHNQLVNLRGNIRVFCRVKPHPLPALACQADGLSVKVDQDQTFSFDKVFGPASTQQQVFQEVAELVQSALDGYQVCLFSYGQTGAGKTHTMQGSRSADGQGIIPRAVARILEEAARLKGEGWEYVIEASFVEVYNESLRDLLAEGKGRDVGKIPDANAIKHHPGGGPSSVPGATCVSVTSNETAAALIKRAAAARAVEATAMNAVSSRSHSVFMLYIRGHHAASATYLQGGLNLVDLAGSERLNRSQVEGQRQKEACSINKSLSALGDVFEALAKKSPHVPYRNSKLTHLLQPCLGGDGKTLMFVNVNPEVESLPETLCSLRFAAKVNACQTAAAGGAKRHISDRQSGAAAPQGVKRQSLTAHGKRKAPPLPQLRNSKPKLGA